MVELDKNEHYVVLEIYIALLRVKYGFVGSGILLFYFYYCK